MSPEAYTRGAVGFDGYRAPVRWFVTFGARRGLSGYRKMSTRGRISAQNVSS